jgi:hypothetical protein
MSHREEAPRQQLTAPDSSETPRTSALNNRLTFTDGHMDDFYAQMFQLASQLLEIELSQCREAQRWIPVSERLPEDGASVLVHCRDGIIVARFGGDCWTSNPAGNAEDEGLYLDETAEAGITHWQPLPSAPKE